MRLACGGRDVIALHTGTKTRSDRSPRVRNALDRVADERLVPHVRAEDAEPRGRARDQRADVDGDREDGGRVGLESRHCLPCRRRCGDGRGPPGRIDAVDRRPSRRRRRDHASCSHDHQAERSIATSRVLRIEASIHARNRPAPRDGRGYGTSAKRWASGSPTRLRRLAPTGDVELAHLEHRPHHALGAFRIGVGEALPKRSGRSATTRRTCPRASRTRPGCHPATGSPTGRRPRPASRSSR